MYGTGCWFARKSIHSTVLHLDLSWFHWPWNKTLYNMVNILIRVPLLQYFVMSSDLNNFPNNCDDHIETTRISNKWSLATLITVRLLEQFERSKKIAVVSNKAMWDCLAFKEWQIHSTQGVLVLVHVSYIITITPKKNRFHWSLIEYANWKKPC